MKKIYTLLTVGTLGLLGCESAQKKAEVADVNKVTIPANIKSIGTETLHKAIFTVNYDRVARLSKKVDKLFVRSKDQDLGLYRNIKEDLESSLTAEGFTLASASDSNVEVILENNTTNESYMPHFIKITVKKHFKGESVSVIRATMRVNYEDLEKNHSLFIDKFVKVILEGKTVTNNLVEWIVQ